MFQLKEHPLEGKAYFEKDKAWTAFLNFSEDFQKQINVPENVYIHDCTLRDGEQAPGVVFTTDEKVLIASMLDELGVQSIEMGLPMVKKDREAIIQMAKKPHKARLMALTRANTSDIDMAVDLGLDGLVIEHSVNPYTCKFSYDLDEEGLIKKNVEAILYAKKKGFIVNWMGWDAFRVDVSYIERVFKRVVEEADPEIVTIADTFGMVHPLILFNFFQKMRSWFPHKNIEYHAHNDYGMATANAATAILAGANAVHTAINGLGERAGNIPLEEIVINLENLYKINTGINTKGLHRLCKISSQISKFPLSLNKPVAGDNLFKVESGMIMHIFINAEKNGFPHSIMLPYLPETVGQNQLTYVLSKGSGKATVEYFLKKLNYTNYSEQELEEIVIEVKKLATIIKGPLSLADFVQIVNKILEK